MLLNKLVDKDDSLAEGLHFTEYKAYHESPSAVSRVYEDNSKNWLLVQLADGRFDIAKYVLTDSQESSVWKNQDGKVLDNVLNWRPIYPNGEV